MRKNLFLFFFILLLNLSAQYDDRDFYYVEKKEHVVISNKKGELETYAQINERAKFLSSDKLFLARKSIPYDKFRKIENLSASTLLQDGQKKKVTIFETKDELGGMVFYSDNKRKEFYFPNVREGAEIEHSYVERYSNEIPFSYIFRFASYFPIQKAHFSIEVSKDAEIDFKLFNTEGLGVDFSKKEGKKSTVYTWEATNVKGVRIDDDRDSDFESRIYYEPHVVVYLKNYTNAEGEKVKVLGKVEDLYRWYTTLIQSIDEDTNITAKEIAEEITKGIEGDKQKAKAIYQWVQHNISYVAFGDGFGGFIPRGASKVCDKKYGDCKDMAHLLYVMLNHVGVEAYHAWIGSRNKPYTYEQNPTPYVDDHMITLAVVDNDSIFLDGTDSFVEFGYPSSFTQGKESLVGFDATSFEIKTVPIVKSDQNIIDVKTDAVLRNGKVNASEQRTLTGLEKSSFIGSYLKDKEAKTKEEFLNLELKLGNNKTRYTDIQINGVDNVSHELNLSYNLEIDNYYRTVSDRIFINMNFDRLLSEGLVDIDERIYGKKFDNQFVANYKTKLQIPASYQLKDLPEKSTFQTDGFGFDISYEEEGEFIIQSKKIYVNKLHIEVDEFSQWNSFIQNLVGEYKRNLVFVK